MLAQSISNSLGGRKSGKGYRVPTVCHGGDGFNLLLSDTPDGTLIATCFSHGCSYREIMESLESLGLKPKTEFSRKQRQTFAQKNNKRQLRISLALEMHIALQYLNDRNGDNEKSHDSNYLKLHPEFTPMPEEPFERELEAAIRTKKIIGEVYGI